MNKPKTKIVIASVLKPVDDVRNYEKIAISLATNENYAITILGTEGNSLSENSRIVFNSWGKFKRLSLQRLIIQRIFWEKLTQEKPGLIICTTFELLLTSALFSLGIRQKLFSIFRRTISKIFGIRNFIPLACVMY